MRLGACGFLKKTLSPVRAAAVHATVHSETGKSRGKHGGNITGHQALAPTSGSP